jgi:hypothetical protein
MSVPSRRGDARRKLAPANDTVSPVTMWWRDFTVEEGPDGPAEIHRHFI